jgi:hypothetical protein
MKRTFGDASFLLATAIFVLSASCTLAHAQTAAPVLVGKITGNVNTHTAKFGDSVIAKTVKPGKLKDGTDVPKGSKLIGSITGVVAKQGDKNSAIAIKFTDVQLKSGTIVPIQGLIVAIGPDPSSKGEGLGSNSVLGRGGVGSTPGLDPNVGLGHAGDNDEIPKGSTLEGVSLGLHLDSAMATEMIGYRRDIKLDSDVMIKLELE